MKPSISDFCASLNSPARAGVRTRPAMTAPTRPKVTRFIVNSFKGYIGLGSRSLLIREIEYVVGPQPFGRAVLELLCSRLRLLRGELLVAPQQGGLGSREIGEGNAVEPCVSDRHLGVEPRHVALGAL